jgi:hypothetical protein
MATYEIIIRNGAGGGQKPVSAPNAQDTGRRSSESGANENGGSDASSIGKSAYGIAKRAVTMGVNHMVNTVNLRTGHAELQQRYQMINDIASRTFGIVESIAAGALWAAASVRRSAR